MLYLQPNHPSLTRDKMVFARISLITLRTFRLATQRTRGGNTIKQSSKELYSKNNPRRPFRKDPAGYTPYGAQRNQHAAKPVHYTM